MTRIQVALSTLMWLCVIGPLAADEKQMSLSELQQMVLAQQDQLAAQQQLLEQQSQTMDAQARVIQGLRTQVDQLAQAGGTQAPAMTNDELQLQERLTAVEQKLQESPDEPKNVLTAGDFPGSIRVPGTGLSGKVGGWVRIGAVASLDPIGSRDRFVTGTIPVSADEKDEIIDEGVVISAKRSRLNWDMRLDSSVGQFRAFVEGDFAGTGASGTNDLRLRHAYGQYNRAIVGQTWSTLMDLAADPEEVDFEGLNAQIVVRQPELRWRIGVGKKRHLALGLEDPNPSITGGDGVSRFPDVVVRATKEGEWGHLQVGTIFRNVVGIPLDDSGSRISDHKDATYGWGLTVSGRLPLKLGGGRDNLMFQLNGGEGLGRYINDLGTLGGFDAAFDPETLKLRTIPVVAGYVAYQHWWGNQALGLFRAARSTLVVGSVWVDDLDFLPGSFYHKTQRASANWMWSPISQIDLGVEFLWGSRENKDGARAIARQLQLVATFRF